MVTEMKKILGLDLGIASIGWALISENDERREIIGMGCRIIPLSTDDKDEFSSGNKISKNQKRTQKRTQRKGYDRYQLRRKVLTEELLKHDMFDETLFKLNPLELWGLRAKAVTKKITLKEFGRVLYHLNQKRGYKSAKSDANMDKKDTEYVEEVKSRHQEIREQRITIGQKFYSELQKNEHYRIRQQVFPREAYIEEFETICKQQQKHYPKIITDEFITRCRDEIIYFQRKLKSQKGLVNVCEFEGFWTNTNNQKEIFVGPKVAPKSSPLFQICKIWETINNIHLKNKRGSSYEIPLEKRQDIFNYLDSNEKLTQAELFKILELKKDDGWYSNKQIAKGLQGNVTKTELLKYLGKDSPLLSLNLTVERNDEEVYLIDKKTGEVIGTNTKKIIAPYIETQPLYQLWHTIYSISDLEECTNALIKKFNLEKELAEKLAGIDFTKSAFGNKSVRAMRKILPYLMDGFIFSDACSLAGYNHSGSQTKDEKLKRKLKEVIPILPKNSLRQPVVEKILNQLINLINAVNAKYGKPDEIRIELARELKQSREERNETFANLSRRERENDTIRKRLQEEYGFKPSRNNVLKWRLFHEINGEESKVNAVCIYCGKQFGITDALAGNSVDIEHIIPQSLFFDDSQSNKTLSHRYCNEAKGNRTAFDFMQSKGEEKLQEYIEMVDKLYKDKIIRKAKRDKLLMPENKIPKDFIDRQLRETQYIAKKAKEILEQICVNVWSTSGSVTEHLRRIWGWDDVLMNLQLPKYREMNLTQLIVVENNNKQKHKKEIIKGWSKRDDQRHHAIDALTIACTKQGFIQRLNTLNSQHTRDEMFAEVKNQSNGFREKMSLLDKYLILQKPFTTKQLEEKASEILISLKAGKKVATISKYKAKGINKEKGVIVPRGALSEESVYGKIKAIEKNKPTKYLFENPHLIFKTYIKLLVEERLTKFENNSKKALASLKQEPIYLDKEKTKLLEYGTCFKEEYVIKYPIESIKAKDTDYIIDLRIKELVKTRLAQHNNKEKEAFKEPLYFNEDKKIPIKTVRMFTGLSAVEPIKRDVNGKEIGFVKPGNNHHIAFYIDENDKKVEHLCSFWHAVERKKYDLPIIIKNPNEVWDKVLSSEVDYPDSFLEKLPNDKLVFNTSLQQNEMFILGMEIEEFKAAIKENNNRILSDYLYICWSISESDYWFRHHLETRNTELKSLSGSKEAKRYYRCKSIGAFEKLNPQKVIINNLGEIVK